MSSADEVSERGFPHYRWVVCALLFFATTSNYIDRQILGILAPDLQKTIGWNEIEYGYIVTSFQAAYALGLLGFGWIVDRIGTKRGLAFAVFFWSLAAMAHGLASRTVHFCFARFALGLAEAGNFPASIKAVAEWFPKRERALATGIFNSGTNIGAVVAPLCVPWIALHYGWQAAFFLTGAIGLLWIGLWCIFFHAPETSPFVRRSELKHISAGQETASRKISWLEAIKFRQTWGFALAKFLTDPVWWFYLYWIPKYLNKEYGITLLAMGAPLVVIYLIADIGSIGGGWLSSRLISRGASVSRARKLTMLLCALLVLPIIALLNTSNLWTAVTLIGIAAAAHQGWSANLFTSVSDIFPKEAVGSVVGVGGMAGAVGGMLIATATGYILEFTGSYVILFCLCGSAYLVALFLLHFLVKEIKPIIL